ncbi:MAG TPA: hypothetical protein VFR15_06895 [Chloroflexia bacterium]|nr:hypothetical protein [Chloroflexia bacterium]
MITGKPIWWALFWGVVAFFGWLAVLGAAVDVGSSSAWSTIVFVGGIAVVATALCVWWLVIVFRKG